MRQLPSPPARVAPLALLAAGLLGGPVSAEKEPLETDRPDITETSTVVGRGRIQIETSVARERHPGGERLWLTPTLLRLGLDRRWEARLEMDGYSRLSDPARTGITRTAGYSPLEFGAKYHIQDPRDGSRRPSLGAILHVGVPSGSGAFRSRRVLGSAKLAADWDLAPRWSLGMNLGLAADEDDAGRAFAAGTLSAALARELSPKLRFFAEVFLQAPEAAHGRTAAAFDGGAAYLLDPDTQLDFAVGTSLSGRSWPDLFWTVGFSRRF